MTIIRVLLVLLIVIGVAVGWCGQLSDTAQRMAVYQVHVAAEKGAVERQATALQEAQQALDVSLSLNNVTTYAGLAIIVLAGTIWSLLKKPAASAAE
jgi:hypothetical protein